jgi:pimeloyl-ACP methyl ester carboxylesterase
MLRPMCHGMGHRALLRSFGLVGLLSLAIAGVLRADDEPANKPVKTEKDDQQAAPPHESFKRYEIGEGPRSYWIFEPDKPKPDDRAPVVVFLHGWFAVNPGFYGAWIDHLVRDGKVVIFPRYQNDVFTPPQELLPNALAAIRDALGVLATGVGHVRPDTKRFALIGHSAGGNLAAQIAAVAADPHAGLPLPQALVVVMPGEIVPSPLPDLVSISASTLMIVIVGEEDVVVGDLRARQIYTQANAIPASRKRFIFFRSDRHGHPPLIADHTAPTSVHSRLDNGEGVFRAFQMSLGDVNALDKAGFWRMADQVMEASFKGLTLDQAIRDEEQFRHLGFWSDGRKVIPPIMGVDLKTIPRVVPGNGLRLFPWGLSVKPKAPADADARK